MSIFGPDSDDAMALPFWSAAREGRLVLPYGRASGRCTWYPHAGADIEWREVRDLIGQCQKGAISECRIIGALSPR